MINIGIRSKHMSAQRMFFRRYLSSISINFPVCCLLKQKRNVKFDIKFLRESYRTAEALIQVQA